ncbi:MAG: hypothetical protein LBE12_01160 [Planctomycetaceae bacterium]|nr:hypothetical protein [Planctomycetaceae bacterium]
MSYVNFSWNDCKSLATLFVINLDTINYFINYFHALSERFIMVIVYVGCCLNAIAGCSVRDG